MKPNVTRMLVVGLTFVSAIVIPEIVDRLEAKDLAEIVQKNVDARIDERIDERLKQEDK